MKAPPPEPQPGIDDILKSIRRIIDEGAREGEDGDDEEPLLLTTPLPDGDEDNDAMPPLGEPSILNLETPLTENDAKPQHGAAAPEDSLVSAGTDKAVTGSLERLEKARMEEPSSMLGLGAGGKTLEEVVREELRVLLKDWLDNNLADIVETAVEREVERLSRRRR